MSPARNIEHIAPPSPTRRLEGRERETGPSERRRASVTLEGEFKEVPSTVAVSFYAPAEAKRSGITEEELKAAIERFDFIVR